MKGGEYKPRVSKMHLKLRDQQVKTSTYITRLLYKNLMVTTNQKTYDRYTNKITLKIVIKSQEKRTKEEKGKKLQKNLTKWQQEQTY